VDEINLGGTAGDTSRPKELLWDEGFFIFLAKLKEVI
jgi:hypothetical protein